MNTILSENYFKDSLTFLKNKEAEECIGCIDIAISLSSTKALYLYQKVKMLYSLELYEQCTSMIGANIPLLYTYCSLFTFSEVIYYYVCSSKCSESDLSSILLSNNIPRSLAYEYTLILKNHHYDFAKKAVEAKANNEYVICKEYCTLALKQEDNDLSLLLLKAECHTTLGQVGEAIKTYKLILSLDPNHTHSLHALATLLIGQNIFEEANIYLERLTDLNPVDIKFLDLLGTNFFHLRQYEQAIAKFERIISLYPNTKDAYLKLAEIYKYQKQPKLVKHYIKIASKLS